MISNKKYKITMSDKSEWIIPVEIIADHRSLHYEKEYKDFYECLIENTLPLFEDDYEIEEWAKMNMNWSDVKEYAKCIKKPEIDHEREWINCDCEVI